MIIVTGASGTVGSAVAAELKARGYSPRLAYHSSAKADQARAAGDDAVLLDFTRPETLGPALAGAQAIFLVGSGGLSQVDAEINVVVAAQAAGLKKIVKLSVWGAADERYAFAKDVHRPIERAIEDSGLSWTHLRPSGFMQNFITHLAGSIRAKGAIYQNAADAKIAHVDVRDIARVAAQVLTQDGHDGRAYALSGPQGISYGQAAAILSEVLGRKIEYVPVGDDAAKATLLANRVPADYTELVLDLYRYYRSGAVEQTSPTIKAITGRDPISFQQFVRDHASAFG